MSLRARAVRRPHVNLVLARAVGEVRDPAAVGRPRGGKLAHALRVGEVAHLALLRGRGEDVAARAEECAGAARRDGEGLDVVPDVDEVRNGLGEVAEDADGDALRLARLRV